MFTETNAHANKGDLKKEDNQKNEDHLKNERCWLTQKMKTTSHKNVEDLTQKMKTT